MGSMPSFRGLARSIFGASTNQHGKQSDENLIQSMTEEYPIQSNPIHDPARSTPFHAPDRSISEASTGDRPDSPKDKQVRTDWDDCVERIAKASTNEMIKGTNTAVNEYKRNSAELTVESYLRNVRYPIKTPWNKSDATLDDLMFAMGLRHDAALTVTEKAALTTRMMSAMTKAVITAYDQKELDVDQARTAFTAALESGINRLAAIAEASTKQHAKEISHPWITTTLTGIHRAQAEQITNARHDKRMDDLRQRMDSLQKVLNEATTTEEEFRRSTSTDKRLVGR